MYILFSFFVFFFSSRRRHTTFDCDWRSDACSSDLRAGVRLLHLPGAVMEEREHDEDGRSDCRDANPECAHGASLPRRSEERREGKSVDLGGRRIIKKKKEKRRSKNSNSERDVKNQT